MTPLNSTLFVWQDRRLCEPDGLLRTPERLHLRPQLEECQLDGLHVFYGRVQSRY